ncbi:MAG: PilZ domain-containing protein [Gammaproteobacteria bacterium]|nr:PilZ domain-containing protein [Gammaproteobacteria bacterium]NNL99328.1 PilZ domain-containing protein [Gammaproteobacteria bacterium]
MKERRSYFRVDDTVLLKYRVIQTETLDAYSELIFKQYASREGAREVMLEIDTRLEKLLTLLRAESPKLVEAVDLVNRKLTFIERMLNSDVPGEDEETSHHELTEVNLSGSGMAIVAGAPLATGANVEIDLVLLPRYKHMKVFGTVVDCRQRGEEPRYDIGMNFVLVRDEDRDLLVQHCLRRQSQELRKARDEETIAAV